MIQEQTFLDRYGSLDIIGMSEMTRYSGRLKLTKENIAEHSWYVAYYILLVGNDYNIKQNIINKAVSIAIVHDIPELFTNDIPHNIKVNFPNIKAEIEKAELEFMKEKMPNLLKYYDELSQDTLEMLLVNIGDALSILLYTNKEISLGNTSEDMRIISNEVKVRLSRLFDRLEKELK